MTGSACEENGGASGERTHTQLWTGGGEVIEVQPLNEGNSGEDVGNGETSGESWFRL